MPYSINAYAKINLGLDVIRKRPDGYHDLRMIMQTIELHDILTFNVSDGDSIILRCTNSNLCCDNNNLIIKAAKLFTKHIGINKSIDITLEKNIPLAAGMAGGSADAAATFHALNDILDTRLSDNELMKMGVKLGADIPYCIMGGTALSEGIGDILTPIEAPAYATVLIVKPPVDVSTGYVYGNLVLNNDSIHPDIDAIRKVLPVSVSDTGKLLGNILESVTIPAYPIIDDIKKCMTDNGAAGTLMSGSGPTVFGLFVSKSAAERALDACLKLDMNMYGIITGYHI